MSDYHRVYIQGGCYFLLSLLSIELRFLSMQTALKY